MCSRCVGSPFRAWDVERSCARSRQLRIVCSRGSVRVRRNGAPDRNNAAAQAVDYELRFSGPCRPGGASTPTNAYWNCFFPGRSPAAMFDNCPLSNEAAPSDQGARNAAAENPGTQPADAHVPVECACTGLHGAQSPDDLVAEYLTACRSDNTRRAYEIDLRDFAAWAGAFRAAVRWSRSTLHSGADAETANTATPLGWTCCSPSRSFARRPN